MTELMQMLVDAGYPRMEMDHYNSDLYVFVTPITTEVVEAWCTSHSYNREWQCPVFRDQITGRMMFDCICCFAE